MSTQSPTSEYMLLFRGTKWGQDLSPEEIQQVMVQWMAWFDGLVQQGKLKAGQPLVSEGKVVSGKSGTVADGPYAESKEAIGGYFLLQLDSFDEAVEIAKACPALPYGILVEVRPVAAQCPLMQQAGVELARATS